MPQKPYRLFMYKWQNGIKNDATSWVPNFIFASRPKISSNKPMIYIKNIPKNKNNAGSAIDGSQLSFNAIITRIETPMPITVAGANNTPPNRGILL